jgi:D-3-phosphoglycerate dehydrogenase/C-terminal binding protein
MDILLARYFFQDTDIERATAGPDARLTVFRNDPYEPVTAEAAAAAEAVVLYAASGLLGREPAEFPRCRIVVRVGVGFDTVDLEGFGRRGVPVSNVPDYGTSEVADHALALMLSFKRGLVTYHELLRREGAAGWQFGAAPVVRRVRGSVFGVVGMGRIGTAAALRARGFGMEIAFYDPYVPTGLEIALGARRVGSLAELMATSDVVSLHAPSTPETVNMIDAAALSHAKPGLVLVNTARGTLVDLDALLAALKDGRVAAAGLDVLPVEPFDTSHPLVRAWLDREPWLDGRLTFSPHAAFHSPEGQVDLRRKAIETAVTRLKTGKVLNCVNREFLVGQS